MNDPKMYLIYIQECITKIQRLTAEGHEAVESNDNNTAALLYYLHTMAEATQHLPEPLKMQYPDIPWQQISGFRNRLVHGYLSMDMSIIWRIVDHSLLPLKTAIEAMLQEMDANQSNDKTP